MNRPPLCCLGIYRIVRMVPTIGQFKKRFGRMRKAVVLYVHNEKYVCPHCGTGELVYKGLQWFPLTVFQNQGWSPVQYSDDGKSGAVRLYVCRTCPNSFIEPSLS